MVYSTNLIKVLQISNSWQEFKAQLQTFSKKAKGDAFEALTKHFLQLHPRYATKLKNVWLDWISRLARKEDQK